MSSQIAQSDLYAQDNQSNTFEAVSASGAPLQTTSAPKTNLPNGMDMGPYHPHSPALAGSDGLVLAPEAPVRCENESETDYTARLHAHIADMRIAQSQAVQNAEKHQQRHGACHSEVLRLRKVLKTILAKNSTEHMGYDEAIEIANSINVDDKHPCHLLDYADAPLVCSADVGAEQKLDSAFPSEEVLATPIADVGADQKVDSAYPSEEVVASPAKDVVPSQGLAEDESGAQKLNDDYSLGPSVKEFEEKFGSGADNAKDENAEMDRDVKNGDNVHEEEQSKTPLNDDDGGWTKVESRRSRRASKRNSVAAPSMVQRLSNASRKFSDVQSRKASIASTTAENKDPSLVPAASSNSSRQSSRRSSHESKLVTPSRKYSDVVAALPEEAPAVSNQNQVDAPSDELLENKHDTAITKEKADEPSAIANQEAAPSHEISENKDAHAVSEEKVDEPSVVANQDGVPSHEISENEDVHVVAEVKEQAVVRLMDGPTDELVGNKDANTFVEENMEGQAVVNLAEKVFANEEAALNENQEITQGSTKVESRRSRKASKRESFMAPSMERKRSSNASRKFSESQSRKSSTVSTGAEINDPVPVFATSNKSSPQSSRRPSNENSLVTPSRKYSDVVAAMVEETPAVVSQTDSPSDEKIENRDTTVEGNVNKNEKNENMAIDAITNDESINDQPSASTTESTPDNIDAVLQEIAEGANNDDDGWTKVESRRSRRASKRSSVAASMERKRSSNASRKFSETQSRKASRTSITAETNESAPVIATSNKASPQSSRRPSDEKSLVSPSRKYSDVIAAILEETPFVVSQIDALSDDKIENKDGLIIADEKSEESPTGFGQIDASSLESFKNSDAVIAEENPVGNSQIDAPSDDQIENKDIVVNSGVQEINEGEVNVQSDENNDSPITSHMEQPAEETLTILEESLKSNEKDIHLEEPQEDQQINNDEEASLNVLNDEAISAKQSRSSSVVANTGFSRKNSGYEDSEKTLSPELSFNTIDEANLANHSNEPSDDAEVDKEIMGEENQNSDEIPENTENAEISENAKEEVPEKPKTWMESLKKMFDKIKTLPGDHNEKEEKVQEEQMVPLASRDVPSDSREIVLSSDDVNVASSEPNLSPAEEPEDLNDKLDLAIANVEEDIAKTHPILEERKPSPPSKQEIDAVKMAQIAKLLEDPSLNEMLKDSLTFLYDNLQKAQEELAIKDDVIEKTQSDLEEAKDEASKWKDYATGLEKDNDELKVENEELKTENAKLKSSEANLIKSLENLEQQIPDLEKHLADKQGILNYEALGLIGRLKRIWNNLLKMYLEKGEMPDTSSIKEVDFILDQIDVSVEIVGSLLKRE